MPLLQKEGQMMTDFPKIAKRRKREEEPDAEKGRIAARLDMLTKIVISALTWKTAQWSGI